MNLFLQISLQLRTDDFDKISKIWLQPFSALINCMFPVECVYGDRMGWQAFHKIAHADPKFLTGKSEEDKEAGSQIEGFCIPLTLWQPDSDGMTERSPFVENDEKKTISIFTVEHADNDPRYAKLRLTNE